MDIYRQAKNSEKRASIFPMESQEAKRFSDDRQTTSGIDPSWRLTQGSWAIPPRMREDSALQLTTAPQNVPTFLSWEISSTDTWSSQCRWIVESTHKLVDERIKIPLDGEWWECKLQPESIWRIRDRLHYCIWFCFPKGFGSTADITHVATSICFCWYIDVLMLNSKQTNTTSHLILSWPFTSYKY